ncbi:MAG: ThuA domain-containing protein [Gemmataceae bacterium]
MISICSPLLLFYGLAPRATWVRTQGKGRVFYTASGHDERVFRTADYHRLIIQGIRWAVGRPDHQYVLKRFEYLPGELPNYRAGRSARLHQRQAPLSPAETMKHLSVPGGFHVEQFAAQTGIVKPITLAWDGRGPRLLRRCFLPILRLNASHSFLI